MCLGLEERKQLCIRVIHTNAYSCIHSIDSTCGIYIYMYSFYIIIRVGMQQIDQSCLTLLGASQAPGGCDHGRFHPFSCHETFATWKGEQGNWMR